MGNRRVDRRNDPGSVSELYHDNYCAQRRNGRPIRLAPRVDKERWVVLGFSKRDGREDQRVLERVDWEWHEGGGKVKKERPSAARAVRAWYCSEGLRVRRSYEALAFLF